MKEEKFRPYSVLVMQDEEVILIFSMDSLNNAVDRVTDLMVEELKTVKPRLTSLNVRESPRWYRIAPTDEVEEDL